MREPHPKIVYRTRTNGVSYFRCNIKQNSADKYDWNDEGGRGRTYQGDDGEEKAEIADFEGGGPAFGVAF